MSWAVWWDGEHGRFRGYGVPAYCDAHGCETEIDRGFGCLCDCEKCRDIDELDKDVFVCGEHTCADVDEANLPPEHPSWTAHLLTDESWEQWRTENPERVAAMRGVA